MLPTIVSVTFTRDAAGSLAGATLSLRAERGLATAVTALGLIDTTAGEPTSVSVATIFPVYAGCFTRRASPATSTAVASAASGTPALAATRGARSFPCAEALSTHARYPPAARRAATVAAMDSGS